VGSSHIFFHTIQKVLSQMSKWYSENKLSVNLDKTNIVKFVKKTSTRYPLNPGHNDNYIEEAVNTTFFGIQIYNNCKWKNHIDQPLILVSIVEELFERKNSSSGLENREYGSGDLLR
jgi:hypothetical protein